MNDFVDPHVQDVQELVGQFPPQVSEWSFKIKIYSSMIVNLFMVHFLYEYYKVIFVDF